MSGRVTPLLKRGDRVMYTYFKPQEYHREWGYFGFCPLEDLTGNTFVVAGVACFKDNTPYYELFPLRGIIADRSVGIAPQAVSANNIIKIYSP